VARLFVAVRPPPDVLEVVAALPRPDEPGVRWVPASQWHVTVRFLGEADEDAADAAVRRVPALLADGGGGSPAIEAVLGPAVSRLGRSVVCIPVAGLDALAAAVADATATVGEPVDPRPFTGHLTLARLRNRGSCRLAGTKVSARFPVPEIELVRSTLGSAGARHEVLTVVALAD
jgi:RNA 2',3'-cyclic 3'-phosphodiesterase